MNSNKGFSLLEILVAFSIMAVSLGIVLKIFSSGVNTAIIAEEYTMATQIAESLMAKTGIEEPLEEGEHRGTEADKYDWKVNVSMLPKPEIDEESPVKLLTVQVIVKWGDGNENQRTIELNTVKTMQADDEEDDDD
ncbi:MAG: prepilin-type N-terminal cleavage/methylation domain-containing protein [Methylococcaceae bacterium]